MNNKQFDRDLLRARTIIRNLNDDTVIKEEVLPYGCNEASITLASNLYEEVEALYQEWMNGRGEQRKYMDLELKLARTLGKRYTNYREVLRKAYADKPEIQMELKLDLPKPRILASLISQGINFYQNLIKKPRLIEGILLLDLTPEKITEELVQFTELQDLYKIHQRVKGETQRLRVERDKKMCTLNGMIDTIKQVLLLAFAGTNPQTLERLGIFVRNQRKRKTGTEPATEPVTDPGTEPATEPVTEPVGTEPTGTEPATEPVTEPAASRVGAQPVESRSRKKKR